MQLKASSGLIEDLYKYGFQKGFPAAVVYKSSGLFIFFHLVSTIAFKKIDERLLS
ncbi:MAG: hypothetical protein QM768_03500 [Agriterribacter sp.]